MKNIKISLFSLVLGLLGLFYFSPVTLAEQVINDNLYVAYSKINPSKSLDIANNEKNANYKSLILYDSHGRGNQLLGYQYREKEQGYIIYAARNEQELLRAETSNTIKAVTQKQPINEASTFGPEYIWSIEEAPNDPGFYMISNKQSKKYITGASTYNEAYATLKAKDNSSSQRFRLQTMNGIYRIKSYAHDNMVWDIDGVPEPNKKVISYPFESYQENQEWIILYKPVDDMYVISNNQERNLILSQDPYSYYGANTPKVVENNLDFEQKYPSDRLLFFNTIRFNEQGNSIVRMARTENPNSSTAPNYYYTKDNVIDGASKLNIQSFKNDNTQLWELDKIAEITSPQIRDVEIKSNMPIEKDYFYVGEKLSLTGEYVGFGYKTFDLYSKFDTEVPVLINDPENAFLIPNNGTTPFSTKLDTSSYREGDFFIEVFSRSDSIVQSNKKAEKYKFVYPTPTGEAVPQSIAQNTPISQLNGADFVTNLSDEISSEITVDKGIKNLDTRKIGTQMAQVTIRNQYKESVIEVPVSVGLVWGDVPWTYNDQTKELTFTGGGTLGESSSSPWNRSDYRIPSVDIKTITFKESVKAPANSQFLFDSNQSKALINVSHINGLNKVDTSEVVNADNMFRRMKSLEEIDLTAFDTGRMETFNYMFSEMNQLEELDLSRFDMMNKSVNTKYMLYDSKQLKVLVLGEKTRLTDTSLVIPNGEEYTGNWQSVGGGTISNPRGEFIGSSLDLEKLTREAPINEIFVWESKSNVTISVNYYLENSEKPIIEKLDTGTQKESDTYLVPHEHKTIEDILTENKIETNPEFEGYVFSKEQTTIRGNEFGEDYKLGDTMPKTDVTINYYFEPTIQFTYPTQVDFGTRPSSEWSNVYGMKPSSLEEENHISIIDTFETNEEIPDWTLYMSTEGFYHETSGVRLLADIMLNLPGHSSPVMITNEDTLLYENSSDYKKNIGLVEQNNGEGLYVRVAKVRELGQYNGVLKYKLQVVP